MIWCITWAAAASIVAVIEFAVAWRYMYKYYYLRKSYIDWRYRSCFRYLSSLDEIPSLDETRGNNNGD